MYRTTIHPGYHILTLLIDLMHEKPARDLEYGEGSRDKLPDQAIRVCTRFPRSWVQQDRLISANGDPGWLRRIRHWRSVECNFTRFGGCCSSTVAILDAMELLRYYVCFEVNGDYIERVRFGLVVTFDIARLLGCLGCFPNVWKDRVDGVDIALECLPSKSLFRIWSSQASEASRC